MDATGAVARLFQSIATGEELRKKSNAELADLVRAHIWADLELTSPQADLLGEVMDRLRGLKTCAECKGRGYIQHERCGACDGTGDVDG